MIEIKNTPILWSIGDISREDIGKLFDAAPAPPQFMSAFANEEMEIMDCGQYFQRVLLDRMYIVDINIIEGGNYMKLTFRTGDGSYPTHRVFSPVQLAESGLIDLGGMIF